MPKPKAQVAITGKLLKLIVGLYNPFLRPGSHDRDRVFTCQFQHKGAGGGTR